MVCLQVTLKECDTFDLRVLKGPSDYVAAANSTETTEKIEACMKVWIKQIEQVRRVRQQVRSYPQTFYHFKPVLYCLYVVQNSLWSDFETDFMLRSKLA